MHLVPSVFDLVPNGGPFAGRRTNYQLRGTILLRLEQEQQDEPLDCIFLNLTGRLQNINEVLAAFWE